jgi:hypothetical protein
MYIFSPPTPPFIPLVLIPLLVKTANLESGSHLYFSGNLNQCICVIQVKVKGIETFIGNIFSCRDVYIWNRNGLKIFSVTSLGSIGTGAGLGLSCLSRFSRGCFSSGCVKRIAKE